MAATLGVETIQHTNGTTAVTVGTNGSVTAAGAVTAGGGITATAGTFNGTTGQITTDNSGHITSKQSLDVATAGGRFIGKSNRGELGQIAIEQTANSTDGGYIRFATSASGSTSPTDRMHIDSSGHVGINNTAPANYLEGELVVGNGTKDQYINVVTGTGNAAGLCFQDTTGTSIVGGLRYTHSDNVLALWANGVERMRVASTARQTINGNAGANAHGNFVGEVGISGRALEFEHTVGGGGVGTVITTASSTAYNTSSDYRLKENVDYTWDATTRLKQLKPARFNFIVDETNTLVDGFLAHEVSSIVPEAITGTKDAMTTEVLYVEGDELPEGVSIGDVKEASVPDYQGIDQSKLVPLLVKTIQELEARITALEA